MNALEIVRQFQDEGDIGDGTMLVALCEFIDGHCMTAELREAFELFKTE